MSVNYRLSPHPDYPAQKVDDGGRDEDEGKNDEGRGEGKNVMWPTHINDVRDAIRWLQRPGAELGEGKEWIICGHSVGGTMAVMLGMEPKLSSPSPPLPPNHNPEYDDYGWGREMEMPGLVGVIGISGIYDFTACRDAHLAMRDVYDSFIAGAFGLEGEGGWERGNVRACGRKVGRGVRVVVLGHSRGDELVEWEQVGGMYGKVEWEEGMGGRKVVVEVEGGHEEVVEGGVGVGRCVGRCVEVLVGMEGRRGGARGDGL